MSATRPQLLDLRGAIWRALGGPWRSLRPLDLAKLARSAALAGDADTTMHRFGGVLPALSRNLPVLIGTDEGFVSCWRIHRIRSEAHRIA